MALAAPRAWSDESPLDALRSAALVLHQASKSLVSPVDTQSDALVVYIGSTAKSAWLREIWVGIDNQPLTRYVYSQQEAEALAAQGLHQLLVSKLAPGKHRLRAQGAAAALDAGASDPRKRAAIDLEFEKSAWPMQIELDWTEASFAGQPALKLREWTAATDHAAAFAHSVVLPLGSTDDPRVRAATFLQATGHRFMAGALRQQLGNGGSPLAADPVAAVTDDAAALYAAFNAQAGGMAGGNRMAALEAIVTGAACERSARLLCDRLNTALGYQWLAGHNGNAAIAAFRRVRDPGPYANSALLGLGWALLAPLSADATTAPAVIGSQPRVLRPMQPKERAEALRAAMVPWVELTGRDPTDPAVQEGQIAVPWALSQLEAQVQAQDYYNRAVTQMEAIVRRTDKAVTEVQGGKLRTAILSRDVGEAWHWGLADLLPDSRWWLYPPEPLRETFYLEPLLGDKRFRDAIASLQELQEIDATLATDQQSLSALGQADFLARAKQLRATLAVQREATCRELEAIAAASLHQLKQQTQAYLVEVRYALAQLYDRAPEVASQ